MAEIEPLPMSINGQVADQAVQKGFVLDPKLTRFPLLSRILPVGLVRAHGLG